MTEFMNWLRVEMLRLRSFDWGEGSRQVHWLKDGVPKFTSFYPVAGLAAKIAVSQEDLLKVIDSPTVVAELEGKSFTLSWYEECVRLSWLEEGISEWETHIDRRFYQEEGKFYSELRLTDKVAYLDGAERIVSDTGEPKRVRIPESEFRDVMKHAH